MSGSGISRAIFKSAPRSRQITMPAPHHSVFTDRMPFLPPNQQRQSTEGKFTEGKLTVSSFSKIQIGLTFLVPAQLGSPGKRSVKRVCVCVCFQDNLVSRYQKVKTSLDLSEAKDDGVLGCSGISCTICKPSAPHSGQITTPAPYY